MGKAHVNGYKKISYMTWPPPLQPRLVSIAGRNEEAVAGAAARSGFERYVTDWRARRGPAAVRLAHRAAEVCDAILRSAESGRREPISYR